MIKVTGVNLFKIVLEVTVMAVVVICVTVIRILTLFIL
jgi:hypothetical protein